MKLPSGIFSGLAAAIIGSGILIPLPTVLRAETQTGSEDLQLGDRAFARGDFAAAERFYRKALVLLASPLWENGAEKLCRACLARGNVSAAYNILTELKKRAPGRPAELLSGMVLAADGNFPEAIHEFEKAAARGGNDRPEALYRLAAAYLASGRYQEAADRFFELEKLPVSPYARKGRRGRIYTLIRQGKTEEASALLKEFPRSDDAEKLEMLRLVKAGDLGRFKTLWTEKRKSFGDPRPDSLLYEICGAGSSLALANNDRELAETCLRDAFDFSSDDAGRKDVMYRLFNLQSRSDPAAAVETVRRYCAAFPDSTAKAILQIQGGRLLAAAGRYKEAVDLFSEVLKDRENLLDERRAAAADAAAAAEKGGLRDEAKKMHGYLITHAVSPEQKQSSELRLAEYCLRQKDHPAAEKYLDQVILQGGRLAENARVTLLSALMESKQHGKAKTVARELLAAADPVQANFGRFQLARLAEKENDLPRARSLYLDCLKQAPGSPFSPAARFSAAAIAEKTGDLAAAAKEYLDFARMHPADPNTPPALFLALRADCLAGTEKTAETALALLEKNHPGSPESRAARLQLADHFFLARAYDKALALLTAGGSASARANDPAFALLAARIKLAAGKPAEAFQTADAALKRSPEAEEAPDLGFLCGNILADMGETAQALACFRQAEKRRSSGIFGEILSGRIADCSRILFSDSRLDKKLIEDAFSRYGKLASDAKLPEIRLQSICKAAACCELMKKDPQAIDLYEKTLYFAALLRSGGISPDPVWCARAAYDGARAALRKPRPERLVRALRLIRLYEDLALPNTGEDFKALRSELRSAYNRMKSQRKDR
ncbi:MAG: tetratricopeptide repeat protein [Lentisphaeria bacterium]|nr:tetratricopeptide repeat protein [Lentisphaeria bacterium]